MSASETKAGAVREMLNHLKQALQGVYGERLPSTILYGSHARGEAQGRSDVDVLVVLKGCTDPISERDRMSDILLDLDLEYETVVSVVVVDAHDLETRETPFRINARREGRRQ